MHERILLCDDDAITTASMGAALRDAGYLVSEATTVDQCLSVAARERHDLALIDVMMPPGSFEWQETKGGYASGIALARRLRQIQPDLKIMGMSNAPIAKWCSGSSIMRMASFLSERHSRMQTSSHVGRSAS